MHRRQAVRGEPSQYRSARSKRVASLWHLHGNEISWPDFPACCRTNGAQWKMVSCPDSRRAVYHARIAEQADFGVVPWRRCTHLHCERNAAFTRLSATYDDPLKQKTGGRITHPFGGLRLLSHLPERVRREKILQGESAPPNDGRPEPKRDRPFPIERPVA